MLFVAYHPGIKLDCQGPVRSSMTLRKRLANILLTTLMITLLRHIGRNCEMDSGCSCFGSKHRIDAFRDSGTSPDRNTFCTKVTTDSPTMFQYRWKKLVGKPSGPGALLAPICETACHISTCETDRLSNLVCIQVSLGKFHSSGRWVSEMSFVYNSI